MISLDFIDDVTTYGDMTDQMLRDYLDKKTETSKYVVTMTIIDDLVSKNLRTDMQNQPESSRIQGVFVSYLSLLRRHGLQWIVEDNQKVAVAHVLSAIRPTYLRTRLESDLDLSYHALKKDFKGFVKHVIQLAEAFQFLDNGKQDLQDNNASGQQRSSN